MPRMFQQPRSRDTITDLKPSIKNSELPPEERKYMGHTIQERIEMYCAYDCKTKPCDPGCILHDGSPGNPLSKIGRFCQQCIAKQGARECKNWNCHLRPCAP